MSKIKILATLFTIATSINMATAQEYSPSADKQSNKTEQVDSVYYSCPMHTSVVDGRPGHCPHCGMELQKKIATNYNTCLLHPHARMDAPGPCPQCIVNGEKMKVYYSCPTHTKAKMDNPGTCAQCGMPLEKKTARKAKIINHKDEGSKLYTCPDHQEVRSRKPANCSQCGKALTETKKK